MTGEQITAVEELEALPAQSVYRVFTLTFVRMAGKPRESEWWEAGSTRHRHTGEVPLGGVVLYRPDRPVGPDVEEVVRFAEAASQTPYTAVELAELAVALGPPARPSVVSREQVESAYREAWADLQAHPESKIAFGRMDALAAVLRAFTSGAITLKPGMDDEPERCPICAGLNGVHGLVHERYGNGGGGNSPCPNGPRYRHHRAPITDEGGVVVFWWCDTTGRRVKDCPTCLAARGEDGG